MKNLCISLLGLGVALISASAGADTVVSAASGKPYYFNQWSCFIPYSQSQVSTVAGACNGGGGPNAFYWETYLQNSTSSTVSRTLSAYGRQADPISCAFGYCRSTCTGIVTTPAGDAVSWTATPNLPTTTANWVTLGTFNVAAGNPIVVECFLSDFNPGVLGYVSAVKASGGAL